MIPYIEKYTCAQYYSQYQLESYKCPIDLKKRMKRDILNRVNENLIEMGYITEKYVIKYVWENIQLPVELSSYNQTHELKLTAYAYRAGDLLV